MPLLNVSPDINIHFLDHNSRSHQVIILLHGLGVNGASWELQIDPFAKAGYRVICPDLRGFGLSTYDDSDISISIMSYDISKLMTLLKLDNANIVGISMGGTVALQLALDYPDKVSRLILANTFASLRPKNPAVWAYFALRFFLVHFVSLRAQSKAVAKRIFPRQDQELLRVKLIQQVNQANVKAYRKAMRALAAFNVISQLGKINIPTLVITGENDTTVPPAVQTELAKHLRNCDHIFLPAAGHAACIDQAELFNSTVLQFLSSH